MESAKVFLCLVVQLAVILLLIRRSKAQWFLRCSLIFCVSMWYVIPSAIVVYHGYEAVQAKMYRALSEADFSNCLLIETFGIAIAVSLFLFKKRLKSKTDIDSSAVVADKEFLPNFRSIALIGLGISLILSVVDQRLNYLERNSVNNYGSSSSIYSNVFGELLKIFAIAIALRTKNTVFFYLVLVVDSLQAGLLFISGGRIALIHPIWTFFSRFPSYANSLLRIKYAIPALLLGLFLYFLVLPISILVSSLRQYGSVSFEDIMNSRKWEEYTNFERISRELFGKFDSFSAGAIIRKVDGNGVAGTRPYIGACSVLVPRFFWSSKPVSGSFDGSLLGHPSRHVPRLCGIKSDSLNVGVSPCSIAIWQFGIMGFGLFILSQYLVFSYLNYLFKGGILFHLAGLYMLSAPSFQRLVASPDVILMYVILTSPLVFYGVFYERKRNSN